MKRFYISWLVTFSFLILSCASPSKSFHKTLLKAPYDVIIVPGVPYLDHDWSADIMKERIVWSCFLYAKGITRNVIYSGNADYSPYVEGKIMAMHAIALGIPKEHVFCETQAEHSTQNLIFSYRMARRLGFEKIALATDPFQSIALKPYAWDYSIPVTFIPIVYDSLRSFTVDSSLHIDPSSAFISNFIPLPRRQNIIKRIIGTLGIENE